MNRTLEEDIAAGHTGGVEGLDTDLAKAAVRMDRYPYLKAMELPALRACVEVFGVGDDQTCLWTQHFDVLTRRDRLEHGAVGLWPNALSGRVALARELAELIEHTAHAAAQGPDGELERVRTVTAYSGLLVGILAVAGPVDRDAYIRRRGLLMETPGGPELNTGFTHLASRWFVGQWMDAMGVTRQFPTLRGVDPVPVDVLHMTYVEQLINQLAALDVQHRTARELLRDIVHDGATIESLSRVLCTVDPTMNEIACQMIAKQTALNDPVDSGGATLSTQAEFDAGMHYGTQAADNLRTAFATAYSGPLEDIPAPTSPPSPPPAPHRPIFPGWLRQIVRGRMPRSVPGSPAAWSVRALGYLIDWVPIYVLAMVGALPLSGVDFVVAVVDCGWLLFLAVQLGQTGSTPGMRVLGLRAVGGDTGQPIGAGRAIVRALAQLVLILPSILVWTRRRGPVQTIADRMTSTVVVNAPKQGLSLTAEVLQTPPAQLHPG